MLNGEHYARRIRELEKRLEATRITASEMGSGSGGGGMDASAMNQLQSLQQTLISKIDELKTAGIAARPQSVPHRGATLDESEPSGSAGGGGGGGADPREVERLNNEVRRLRRENVALQEAAERGGGNPEPVSVPKIDISAVKGDPVKKVRTFSTVVAGSIIDASGVAQGSEFIGSRVSLKTG